MNGLECHHDGFDEDPSDQRHDERDQKNQPDPLPGIECRQPSNEPVGANSSVNHAIVVIRLKTAFSGPAVLASV